jgi:cardiolipin synthase
MMAGILGGVLLSLVIVLALVVWSIRRHRDPDLHIECDSGIDQLVPTLAGLTLGTAVAGNTAEVLENGAFFDVLIGRIQAARETVHFETFLWKEGALGRRLADALIDRARARVTVRVLLDAEGSKGAGAGVV